MLVYRARLDATADEVLAVSVRRRPADAALGGSGLNGRYRVLVRYADGAGLIRTHRGEVAAAVPPAAALFPVAWQVDGGEALVTLRAGAPGGRGARGSAAALRIALPVALHAWSVTAVTGAALGVRAVCRPCGGGLLVRGRVFLQLQTAAAEFPLRIPFARLLALEADPGLRWRAAAGLAGFQVQVAPGGAITGEVVVAVRCEGRPEIRPDPPRPRVASIREVSGAVARVEAEVAGDGHAVVRGAVDLDVYWVDVQGRSRWTGRSVPFAALVELPGAEPDDRLQAGARIDRLTRKGEEVHLVLQVTVAALRPEMVALGGAAYRLERHVAASAAAVEATEPLWAAAEPGRPGQRSPALPLPAAIRVDGPATQTATGLSWGQPLPEPPPGGAPPLEAALPLPGPVSGVTGLTIVPERDGWAVSACVRAPGSGQRRVTGRIRAEGKGGRPAGLLAFPMVQNGAWLLRLYIDLASEDAEG